MRAIYFSSTWVVADWLCSLTTRPSAPEFWRCPQEWMEWKLHVLWCSHRCLMVGMILYTIAVFVLYTVCTYHNSAIHTQWRSYTILIPGRFISCHLLAKCLSKVPTQTMHTYYYYTYHVTHIHMSIFIWTSNT